MKEDNDREDGAHGGQTTTHVGAAGKRKEGRGEAAGNGGEEGMPAPALRGTSVPAAALRPGETPPPSAQHLTPTLILRRRVHLLEMNLILRLPPITVHGKLFCYCANRDI